MLELTPAEHCHDETILLAARWLAEQRNPPQPLIPFLRTRFGITTAEACEVCGKASRMRTYRAASA